MTCLIISALVLEDFGAVSLFEQLDLKDDNPAAFLGIAIKITRALYHVHAAGIVCGEVEPAHILINRDMGCLKLTGFSNACSPGSNNWPLVKSLTAYTAPEQTNRMDRVPDHRSDLYSLGVVFYELLTHQRPFDVSGELELTHNILAKKAENPTRIVPGIPQIGLGSNFTHP